MKQFSAILMLWLAAWNLFATTWFVTQSGAGAGDGTTLGNACSLAGYNGSTLTIAPGDVVSFNGSIITGIRPHVSGSVASHITNDFSAATIQVISDINNSNYVGGSFPVHQLSAIFFGGTCNNADFINGTWVAQPAILSYPQDSSVDETNRLLASFSGTTTNQIWSGWHHGGDSNEMSIVFWQSGGSGDVGEIQFTNNWFTNIEKFVYLASAAHDIQVNNNWIQQNINTNWQSDLITFAGGFNYTIHGNFIDLCAPGNQTHPTGDSRHNDIIQTFVQSGKYTYNWDIAYNWIQQDVNTNTAVQSDGSQSYGQMQNLTNSPDNSQDGVDFYDNVLVGTAAGFKGNNTWGVNASGVSGTGASATVRQTMYNNTSIVHGGPTAALSVDNTTLPSAENNVCFSDNGSVTFSMFNNPQPFYSATNANIVFGFTESSPSPYWLGPLGAKTDPKFVNNAGSYWPATGSPLIGGGVTLSGKYAFGIVPGATWPNPQLAARTAPFDIGAYVFPSVPYFGFAPIMPLH